MPKLYVANSSRQHWQFQHRIPGGGLIAIPISSGRQEEVNHIPEGAMDGVIKSLERFGAIPRMDVHRHPKNFQGLIYSLDKPIPESYYHYGHDEVIDQAESRSVVEATKAALASDLILNTPGRERMTGATEVEFEEEVPMRGQAKKRMKLAVDPKAGTSDKVHLQ